MKALGLSAVIHGINSLTVLWNPATPTGFRKRGIQGERKGQCFVVSSGERFYVWAIWLINVLRWGCLINAFRLVVSFIVGLLNWFVVFIG